MNEVPVQLQATAYSYALRAVQTLRFVLHESPIIMGANVRTVLNNPDSNNFSYPWEIVLFSPDKQICHSEPKDLFNDLSVRVVHINEKITDVLELEKFTCNQVCLFRDRVRFSPLYEDFMMDGEEDKRIIYTGHKKDFNVNEALKLQVEYPGYSFWSKKTNSEIKVTAPNPVKRNVHYESFNRIFEQDWDVPNRPVAPVAVDDGIIQPAGRLNQQQIDDLVARERLLMQGDLARLAEGLDREPRVYRANPELEPEEL